MSATTFLIWTAATSHSLIVSEHSQKTPVGGQPDINFGIGVAVSGDTAIVGASGVAVGGNTVAGAAYVFVRTGGNWIQVATLTASDPMMDGYFGFSVAIDADTIVVGAPTNPFAGTGPGAIYVFTRPGGGWLDMVETAKLTANDGVIDDTLGFAVVIDGDTIVSGARRAGAMHQGAAYVFVKPGGGWMDATQTARLTAFDAEADDFFARSVDISGNTVAVGAANEGNSGGGAQDGAGAVYVFERPATGWSNMTETAKLTAADGADIDYLGYSIAIDGDTIVAGAVNDGNSGGGALDGIGAGYVFVKPDSGWTDATNSAKLVYSSAEAYGLFGYSASIHNDRILIGTANLNHSPMSQDGAGAAHLYVRPAGGWNGNLVETGEYSASDATMDRLFGASVDLGEDWMVIGTPGDGVGGNETGSAYFFSFDSDEDGVANHLDHCPDDPDKLDVGICGCGVADVDSDGDLILDCNDHDPANPNPGQTDNDGDGVGDSPPGADQCCGGGVPAMMPLMMLGWRRRNRRRRNPNCIIVGTANS